MTDEQTMLILAGRDTAAELAEQLDAEASCCDDAYEGLVQMSRRHWPVVILAAGSGEFEGLARASRRLQSDSKVFAVCSPPSEPGALALTGEVLDDYFIYPLDPTDIRHIRRTMLMGPAVGHSSGAVQPEQLTALIESASTLASLEQRLAETVGQLLGVEVEWLDADKLEPPQRPLLMFANDAPRVLGSVGGPVTADPAAEAYLDGLQRILPALSATAARTESLHRLAITDHLTQAYNRRYFYAATDRILAEAGRQGRPATLLLYDIDDFKRYNDAYGYAAGDEILRETAELMRRITRSHDILARIGGDEFGVLFWEPEKPRKPDSHPPQSAIALADRFREAIRTHKFGSLGPEATGVLTISGGLATFPEGGRTCRELLRAADKALKTVKAAGKDAIHLIGQE